MSFLFLALKRMLRSLPFLLSLLLLTATVTAALFCDRVIQPQGAGYVAQLGGAETKAVQEGLSARGFVRYETEEEMRRDIENGILACGAIFAPDLETRITSVNLEQSVRLFTSPTANLPTMFRLEIVTELLAAAAPYFSLPILETLAPSTDLRDEIVSAYREKIQDGMGFVFDVETVSGKAPEELGFALSLAVCLLSLFLFFLPLLQGCRLYQPEYHALEKRIGRKNALLTVFLPEAFVSLLLTFLALCLILPLGACLSGKIEFVEWLLPAIISASLSASLGLLLPTVIRRADTLQMLTVPTLLLTLVLCPLFINVANLLPAVRFLQPLLPTYWIFAAKEATLLCGGIALLALPLSALLLYFTHRGIDNPRGI